MILGKEILLEVKKNKIPLCAEISGKLRTLTQFSQLAELYFKGDDWALKNNFPSAELVRTYKGGISPYGLLVDDNKSYQNIRNIAFFGKSESELNYKAFSVGLIIVRHDSTLKLKVSDNAVVYLNLLDNAKVEIECTGNGKVQIFHYGGNFSYSGNVKVTETKFKD